MKLPRLFMYTIMLLWGCTSSYSKYTQDPVHTYIYDNGRGQVKGDLSPLYYDLETLQPIGLSLRFSQNQPRAAYLKSVEIRLFAKDDAGEYTKELPRSKSVVTVSYWNGTYTVETKRENYSGDLHALIDPALDTYQYKDSNIVRFLVENEYAGRVHPDTLQQRIIIRWSDKSEETFTSTLKKTTNSKSCISGRPYG